LPGIAYENPTAPNLTLHSAAHHTNTDATLFGRLQDPALTALEKNVDPFPGRIQTRTGTELFADPETCFVCEGARRLSA
jgi:hypothetical protein